MLRARSGQQIGTPSQAGKLTRLFGDLQCRIQSGSWPAPEPRLDGAGRDAPNPSYAGAVSDRLFYGALITDIAYWKTAEMMWADFSAWLLFAGLVMGVLAALVGLIDFLSNRLIRGLSSAWLHMAGNALVLILALFNSFVHSRDAWTSVVPTGLMLSAMTVLVMVFTGWLGWTMVYRHRVGVAP